MSTGHTVPWKVPSEHLGWEVENRNGFLPYWMCHSGHRNGRSLFSGGMCFGGAVVVKESKQRSGLLSHQH